jgi:hypothetical protein
MEGGAFPLKHPQIYKLAISPWDARLAIREEVESKREREREIC